MASEGERLKRDLRRAAILVLGPLAIMWALAIVNLLLGGALNSLGVHPRTTAGLLGILMMPFLHGGFAHLLANSLPWLVAGGLIASSGLGNFVAVAVITWLSSGLGAWLLGSSGSVHVGASGVIFGFVGYLLVSGWVKRSVIGIVMSLAIGGMYGLAFLLSSLPGQAGISWQGHAFGLIGGACAAVTLGRAERRERAARARLRS